MTTHIILIRHGETDWNAEGRIQGHLPVPLNARGAAQAEALALHVREFPSTPSTAATLLRARQTAELIAELSGHEIRDDYASARVGPRHPYRHASHRGRPRSAASREDLPRVPGGPGHPGRREHPPALRARNPTQSPISPRSHPGQTVMVVSHGGPLGDCYRRAVGRGVEERMKVEPVQRVRQPDPDRRPRLGPGSPGREVEHLSDIGSLPNWEGRSESA